MRSRPPTLDKDGVLAGHVKDRDSGWNKPDHAARGATLEEIGAKAERRALSPELISGRQEVQVTVVSLG